MQIADATVQYSILYMSGLWVGCKQKLFSAASDLAVTASVFCMDNHFFGDSVYIV